MKKVIAGIMLVNSLLISAENIANPINDFGLSILKKMPAEKERMVSPVCIYSAMSMTVPGAAGNTARELKTVMGITTDTALGEGISAALKALKGDGSSLKLVNAAWLQKKYEVKAEFSEMISKYWETVFYPADFVKNAEKHRQEINSFTEKYTDSKIKNLLPKQALTNQTRLILLNALYFKDKWAVEFDKSKSYKDKFKSGRKQHEKTFMFNKSNYAYYEEEGFSAVEIPYKDQIYSMLVILPSAKNSLEVISQKLDAEYLNGICNNLKIMPVELHLPRFAFKTSAELKKAMTECGIKDAFGMKADFSAIEASKELFISKIFHAAAIEVDESGTVAAAATAVVMSRKSLPPPPVIFKADRPFFFAIRHNATGILLFAGEMR